MRRWRMQRKGIKPQSAKAKGRKFQQWVRDLILRMFKTLHPDDCTSRSMGAGGEDILLSPKARKLFPYSIECKSKKAFAIYKDYEQATANSGKYEPLLFIRGDRKAPLVIMDAEYFLELCSGQRK